MEKLKHACFVFVASVLFASSGFCEQPGRFQLVVAGTGDAQYVLKVDTISGDTWLLDSRMADHGDGSLTRLQTWTPIARNFNEALDAARKAGPAVVPFNPK